MVSSSQPGLVRRHRQRGSERDLRGRGNFEKAGHGLDPRCYAFGGVDGQRIGRARGLECELGHEGITCPSVELAEGT